MTEEKKKQQLFVVKDFENRVDDKCCLCGTREDLAKVMASKMECSMFARELKEIPNEKTLYWVEFDRLNWAGCGGGSSELFTNLAQVQDWIIRKIKEWHIDMGEVKFSIYPVYRVINKKGRLTLND